MGNIFFLRSVNIRIIPDPQIIIMSITITKFDPESWLLTLKFTSNKNINLIKIEALFVYQDRPRKILLNTAVKAVRILKIKQNKKNVCNSYIKFENPLQFTSNTRLSF